MLVAPPRVERWGVGSAEPFLETRDQLQERVESGLSGGLKFTFSRPERSTDPRMAFPWARSVITAGRSYLPEAGSPLPEPGQGRVARFAVEDFYLPLREALTEVAVLLESAGHHAGLLVDDSRLVDRAAAVRAGVGWWGKSTMVLAPGAGPWMLLGSVVTDATLEFDAPMARSCGTCIACIPACPTGALDPEGVLDVRRCLAAILQAPGEIPREFRKTIGDRVYGCDDCLTSCPPGQRLLSRAADSRGHVDLVEMLEADDDELLARFGWFYLPGRSPEMLRRNGLIAAGNNPIAELVPVVTGYLGHPNALLRRHAAWALGQMPNSRPILEEALRWESDPSVAAEIRQWLDPSGK